MNEDVMLYVEGSEMAFRCECGANVFRKLEGKPVYYKCNGCGALYYEDQESGTEENVSPGEIDGPGGYYDKGAR